jgi:hypothetical protein
MTNTKISVGAHKEGFIKSDEVFTLVYITVYSGKNTCVKNQIKL